MEQNFDHDNSLQSLRSIIFKEPLTKDVRPHLIEYIRSLITKAKTLPEDRLLGAEGHDIAMDICGALAYQDAEGVDHDGWFNEKDEPLLSQILDASCPLDADPRDPDQWRRLFEVSEKLK